LELCRAWQGWTFEVIGAVGVDLGVSALTRLSAVRAPYGDASPKSEGHTKD